MPPTRPPTLGGGSPALAEPLFRSLYDELHRLSGDQLGREWGAVTISATGLLHESFLKLRDLDAWTDERHFRALAARAMRQVLTERARARQAEKRGGGDRALTLVTSVLGGDDPRMADDVLAVDRALDKLAGHDPALARFVELRFFGGLEVAEVADVLEVSPRTAARMWVRAKAFLARELRAA